MFFLPSREVHSKPIGSTFLTELAIFFTSPSVARSRSGAVVNPLDPSPLNTWPHVCQVPHPPRVLHPSLVSKIGFCIPEWICLRQTTAGCPPGGGAQCPLSPPGVRPTPHCLPTCLTDWKPFFYSWSWAGLWRGWKNNNFFEWKTFVWSLCPGAGVIKFYGVVIKTLMS